MDWERIVVFWTVLLVGILSSVGEVILITSLVIFGSINAIMVVLIVIAGIIPIVCFSQLRQLWSRYYLERELLTESDLQDLMTIRMDVLVRCETLLPPTDVETVTKELVRSHLRFLERILKQFVGTYSYELSVFVDTEHPVIYSYYDSSGQITPSSYSARLTNPNYYRDKRYEVVELLENPSSEVHIISNTRDHTVSYSFVTEEQRQSIRSTLLYCFSSKVPAVLVIACNKPGAFSETNNRLKNLAQCVGLGIYNELELALKLKSPTHKTA